MKNSRYCILLMIPFFAAAVMPWLAPSTVPRVALITVFWLAVINIFLAGFSAGDAAQTLVRNVEPEGRVRLRLLGALGLTILVVLAAALYFLMSPMLAIVVLGAVLLFNGRVVRATQYGQTITPVDYRFLQKNIWVVLGCLLMLLMSYYRYVHA
ncbi:MAG TPA: hypothetical protein VIC26_07735 [Marinagarivorans sp.]